MRPLQVIQTTGFHQQKVYLEWRQSWVNQYTVTEIADLLIADVVEGVDANDYMGPLVKRTDIKAGIIKWTTAYGKITDWEVKTGKAMAITSKKTGDLLVTVQVAVPRKLSRAAKEAICKCKNIRSRKNRRFLSVRASDINPKSSLFSLEARA